MVIFVTLVAAYFFFFRFIFVTLVAAVGLWTCTRFWSKKIFWIFKEDGAQEDVEIVSVCAYMYNNDRKGTDMWEWWKHLTGFQSQSSGIL